MSEQERLEEIKGIVSTWKTILSEGKFPDITSEEVVSVESVIQQAEKKQELDKGIDKAKAMLYDKDQRIEELEKALEDIQFAGPRQLVNNIARQALGDASETG